MKRLYLMLFLLITIKSIAQINVGGVPYSFEHEVVLSEDIPVFSTPMLDVKQLETEDIEDERNGLPPRFGYKHAVNLSMKNSGKWVELDNGDRIWRLEIHCPNAKSINLTFDDYWLPPNGVLYIYGKDKKHVIGGFTLRNNKGKSREEKRGFASGLVYNNSIIIEYFYRNGDELPRLNINAIVHGYRFIERFWEQNREGEFGSSGNCQVNVNCNEGALWQKEKTGVALIIVNS